MLAWVLNLDFAASSAGAPAPSTTDTGAGGGATSGPGVSYKSLISKRAVAPKPPKRLEAKQEDARIEARRLAELEKAEQERLLQERLGLLREARSALLEQLREQQLSEEEIILILDDYTRKQIAAIYLLFI